MIELTQEQRVAVESESSRVLVTAGAGTGKTTVLTARAAGLLARGVSPSSMFLATYTRKAAQELATRLSAEPALVVGTADLWLGTIHSLIFRLLQLFPHACGFPTVPTIISRTDQAAVIRALAEELKRPAPKGLAFIRKTGIRLSATERLFRDIYSMRLKEWNCLDYEGLVELAHDRMVDGPVGAWLRERFTHVLLDEQQDTNCEQIRWLFRLALPNYFCVASSQQQIMSFAGARRSDLLSYAAGATVFPLTLSHRCPGAILDYANTALASTDPIDVPTRSDKAGPAPVCTWHKTAQDEAAWLVSTIDTLLGKPLSQEATAVPNDIAVLARTNTLVGEVADALYAAELPVKTVGRDDILETRTGQAAISALRAAMNRLDAFSWWRLTELAGIPAMARALIREHQLRDGSSWWTAATRLVGSGSTTGSSALVGSLLASIDSLAQWLTANRGSAPQAAADVALRFLKTSAPALKLSPTEWAGLLRVLRQLAESGQAMTVEMFLGWLASRAGVDQLDAAREGITCMTAHSAKGLEFSHVFVIGLEAGVFPSFQSDSPEAQAEERRVFYVAATRAKESLWLSGCVERTQFGRTWQRKPSPFLRLY